MGSLPPEPGTVPDRSLGVEGEFGDPPVSQQGWPTEVNDDEDYE